VFEDDLWRLPLFVAPKQTCARVTLDPRPPTHPSSNPFALLANIDYGEDTEDEDDETQQEGMQRDDGAQRNDGAQRHDGAQRDERAQRSVGAQRNDGAQQQTTEQEQPFDIHADPALYCEWLEMHARWAHPGDTKMREIVAYYPHLFSAQLRKYVRTTVPETRDERRCRTCALMKGARKYRQSKRVKEKKRTTLELRQRHLAAMREARSRDGD